jgi:hypothetical protein
MASSPLTAVGADEGVPLEVELYREDFTQLGFTGRELAAIKQHTGKSLSELLDDENADERFLVFAWLKLRRSGLAIEWDAMLDVVVRVKPGESAADPPKLERSPRSPDSAATGT